MDREIFRVDVVSVGEQDLQLALRIGFRGGSRFATHVLRAPETGMVFMDLRVPGDADLEILGPVIRPLPERMDAEGALPLAMDWVAMHEGPRNPDGRRLFRVCCDEDGSVWGEPCAFLILKHDPWSPGI